MHELSDASARLITRMARREATGHLTPATAELSLRLQVEKVRCPWCRTEPADSALAPPPVPLFGWEHGWDWTSKQHEETRLRVLACERLTVRSLLPMANAVSTHEEFHDATFCTRAVALSEFLPRLSDPADLEQAIARVDRAESWADGLQEGGGPAPSPVLGSRLVLPASVHDVGASGQGDAIRDALHRLRNPTALHFLTPHLDTGLAAAMNGLYIRERLGFVATVLGRPYTP